MTSRSIRPRGAIALTAALVLGVLLAVPAVVRTAESELEFHDVEAQTHEFMGYFESIQLTDDQAATFAEALKPLPAPCCKDRSALTCCCQCNQARTWWGLSKYLIAEKGYDAEQVRAKVAEWFDFTHAGVEPAGDACYRGRCPLPFSQDGCGGMGAESVAF